MRRMHDDPHEFDVEPQVLGRSVRYITQDVLDWIDAKFKKHRSRTSPYEDNPTQSIAVGVPIEVEKDDGL